MVRLEMCKFVSDLGKAFYDCELDSRTRASS